MEETIREISSRLKEVESQTKCLLERLNELFGASKCLGGLCHCMTFCSSAETQMKDVFRQVEAMETKIRERDANDIDRDTKIETLVKDVTYMRGTQDAVQAQSGNPRTHLHKMRRHSALSSYTSSHETENEQKLTSSEDSSKQSYQSPGNRQDKHMLKHKSEEQDLRTLSEFHLSETDDQSSDSDDSATQDRLVSSSSDHRVSDESKDVTKSCDKEKRTQGLYNMQNAQLQRQQQKLMPSEDKAKTSSNSKTRSRNGSMRQDDHSVSDKECAQSNELEQETRTDVVPFGGKAAPEIVEQTKKEYYLTPGVWEVEAKAEEISVQKTALHFLEAVTTILLIDTSQSMAEGNAWIQVKQFVYDYISGLEQISPRVNHLEYLALVTFGAKTRCQQRYTEDFWQIRTVFENLQLGGPSPLYGGLLMAHAVAMTCRKDLITLKNGMIINTKIIILTDGEPTETCLHRGPDLPDPDQKDETIGELLSIMDGFEKKRQILDLFCVPVGNANMELLRMMFARDGGRRLLDYRDGQYFSRRLFLSTKLERRLNFFGGQIFVIPQTDRDMTGRDFAHMQEILDDDRNKTQEAIAKREKNPYEERTSRNERLLPVGSRVRRGPDWEYGNQDGGGPGTVVGHNLYLDMVWVHWDENDDVIQYQYGASGRYSVLAVEEPRMPLPGQPLEVGCVVCPGKDWKLDVATRSSRGVIYAIIDEKGIRKAAVRWDNGKKGIHSYGDDRIHEIQICLTDVSVPTTPRVHRVPAVQSSNNTLAIEGAKSLPEAPSSSQNLTIKSNKNAQASATDTKAPSGQSTVKERESKKTNKNKNVR